MVAALGVYGLTKPLSAIAQSAKVYRVGYVSLGSPDTPSPYLDAFRQGLRECGYVEGKNVILEARLADSSRERADQMVTELVQLKVDVIVTQGGAVFSAYRRAGVTPVVMGYSGDPVEARFVDTLARPGGTRTGMSFLALELVGKRLEVLAQVVPAGHISIVANPEHPGEQTEFRRSQLAAQDLGMRLSYFPARRAEELDAAFNTMSGNGTQAIVVFPDAFTVDHRDKIALFGLDRRLPTVSGWSTYAESGFLITYGPNLRASYAHLATYVDKILKGARPADLPVELPTAIELVINAKTARAIGVKVPQAMLLRADRVIAE